MGTINSDTERAWAAGFFDGEGSCSCSGDGKYLHLSIAQSGEGAKELLERFRSAVGAGCLYGPYTQKIPGRKPFYRVQAKGVFDVATVMDAMWPYLGEVKRRQYEVALASWEDQPYRRQTKRRGSVVVSQ